VKGDVPHHTEVREELPVAAIDDAIFFLKNNKSLTSNDRLTLGSTSLVTIILYVTLKRPQSIVHCINFSEIRCFL